MFEGNGTLSCKSTGGTNSLQREREFYVVLAVRLIVDPPKLRSVTSLRTVYN